MKKNLKNNNLKKKLLNLQIVAGGDSCRLEKSTLNYLYAKYNYNPDYIILRLTQ